MKEALDLYVDMNDMVHFHMQNMAMDDNVSDIELMKEASVMASVLAIHAVNVLIVESDPVMLPVYALTCQNLAKTIASIMEEMIDKKEART